VKTQISSAKFYCHPVHIDITTLLAGQNFTASKIDVHHTQTLHN